MKFLQIALLVAFPAIVFAQPNYHKGYVLKNNGDTLKGYINYREWAYSPLSVEFKTDPANAETLTFTAQNIKGFEITGFETYVSYNGLISMNKNIFPDIPTRYDTTRENKAVFLKQLATGKYVTLYYNNEINKNRFFIAEKNQIPVELKYYEYYDGTGNNVITHDLYRGQLLLYINKFNGGDKKIIDKIGQIKFEDTYLEDIVNKINDAILKNERNIGNDEKKISNFRWFGGIGLNSFTDDYSSSSSTTIGPKFDFGVDYLVNPNVQQFVFRTELSFSTVSDQVSQAGGNLTFTQSSIIITPQFLCNIYNKDKIKIYIDFGINLNILSFYSNNVTEAPNINADFGVVFPLQVGVVFHKKLELSLGRGVGFSDIIVVDKLTGNIGVKYLFN